MLIAYAARRTYEVYVTRNNHQWNKIRFSIWKPTEKSHHVSVSAIRSNLKRNFVLKTWRNWRDLWTIYLVLATFSPQNKRILYATCFRFDEIPYPHIPHLYARSSNILQEAAYDSYENCEFSKFNSDTKLKYKFTTGQAIFFFKVKRRMKKSCEIRGTLINLRKWMQHRGLSIHSKKK